MTGPVMLHVEAWFLYLQAHSVHISTFFLRFQNNRFKPLQHLARYVLIAEVNSLTYFIYRNARTHAVRSFVCKQKSTIPKISTFLIGHFEV